MLQTLLAQSADLHKHLCPRQVLGVRMGLYAGELLSLSLPQTDKRLYTFVETDGCFADGVSVAANCWLGRRTLHLIDYGKVAATFVDTQTEQAIRIYPHPQARHHAADYAPLDAQSRWHAQLAGYQVMPIEELFSWQPVVLSISLKAIISRAGVRVNCACCGEEILNEREIMVDGLPLCIACHAGGYYHALELECQAL